jgi:hypothetical protein
MVRSNDRAADAGCLSTSEKKNPQIFVAKSAVGASFENAGSAEFAAVHALRGCRIHTTIYDNKSIIFISHLFFLIWGGGKRQTRSTGTGQGFI